MEMLRRELPTRPGMLIRANASLGIEEASLTFFRFS